MSALRVLEEADFGIAAEQFELAMHVQGVVAAPEEQNRHLVVLDPLQPAPLFLPVGPGFFDRPKRAQEAMASGKAPPGLENQRTSFLRQPLGGFERLFKVSARKPAGRLRRLG